MDDTQRPARPQRWESSAGADVAVAPTPGYGPKFAPPEPGAQYAPPATPTPVVQRNNGLAIAAFVMSLLSVTLPAIICGVIARRQIDRSGGAEKGRWMATSAIVISCIWIALIVIILLAAALSSPSPDYYSY